MARTKQTAKRGDGGEGSDQSRIPAKDKGKGVADQPRKTKEAVQESTGSVGSRRSNVKHSEDHGTS